MGGTLAIIPTPAAGLDVCQSNLPQVLAATPVPDAHLRPPFRLPPAVTAVGVRREAGLEAVRALAAVERIARAHPRQEAELHQRRAVFVADLQACRGGALGVEADALDLVVDLAADAGRGVLVGQRSLGPSRKRVGVGARTRPPGLGGRRPGWGWRSARPTAFGLALGGGRGAALAEEHRLVGLGQALAEHDRCNHAEVRGL